LGCLKTSAKLGDSIAITAILRDDTSATGVGVSDVNITIADGTGQVAYQFMCLPSESFTLHPGGSFQCETFWNTGEAYDGFVATAGTYSIYISFPGATEMTSAADIQIVG